MIAGMGASGAGVRSSFAERSELTTKALAPMLIHVVSLTTDSAPVSYCRYENRLTLPAFTLPSRLPPDPKIENRARWMKVLLRSVAPIRTMPVSPRLLSE
ncbi:hypothetical protein [Pseudonocardia alni]|uniref:hypothetical protein n=1 Tax=Pseudonocardia alni TaxID=33907 RepID=UPI00279BBC1E|nr:hypothetical protein PaSha_28870 [Pseudonocardia alni]